MSATELSADERAPKAGPPMYTASAPWLMASMPKSAVLAGARSSRVWRGWVMGREESQAIDEKGLDDSKRAQRLTRPIALRGRARGCVRVGRRAAAGQ